MFLRSAVSTKKTALAGIVLMLATPQFVWAQATSSQIISDDAIDALDEVIVYGEPTLRLLRDEVYEAEEHFYDLFNVLNDGKQFDIQCFYRRPLCSQIMRRICEANFVKHSSHGPYLYGKGLPHWAFVRHKTKQMIKVMETLISEHPELHAALLKFSDAKRTFDSAIRDRCVNRLSICGK